MRDYPDTPDIDQTLADPTTWSIPPAELREQVLAVVAAEVASSGIKPLETQPAATVSSHRPFTWLAIAAVCIAMLGVAAVLVRDTGTAAGTRSIALSGTPAAPDASGVAIVRPSGSGMAITVQIDGLVAAPEDAYYAAWLMGEIGALPIGSFHLRSDTPEDIELWSGVSMERYPMLMVTEQREGEPPLPSQIVLLRSVMDPPTP